MRPMLSCLAVLCLVLTASQALCLDVVVDGEARTTIVIPDEALPVVKAAAEELQYHVSLASGAQLPIVAEGEAPEAGGVIYLGACERTSQENVAPAEFEPNHYVIKTVGDDLFIAGDDSPGEPFWVQHSNRNRVGTLFGVYQVLEDTLDAKWLWPGELGIVLTRTVTIRIPDLDDTGGPAFVHTRWRDGGITVGGVDGWSKPAARAIYLNEQGKWLRRHRFAMGVNMDMAHAFTQWWGRFSESNPEYFNLLPDGTRRSDPTYHGAAPSLISMSVGEPAFQKQIVADWVKNRSPERPNIDVSENDTPGKCVCEKCLALDEPDPESDVPFDERVARAKQAFERGDKEWVANLGSLADRYARYYLAVQAEARSIDPEAVVMGYAYANYVRPPVNTELNDHVVIGIVPALMFPWTKEKRDDVREQWDGWSATGARLFLRPNYMLDGHNLPIFVARQLGEDFSYAAAHGMIGTDFDSITGQWSTQGPNLYMLARLHDSPDMPVEDVMSEYCAAFGPAAGAVSEYFAHWESVSAAVTDELYTEADMHWSFLYREADRIFTPALLAKGRELIERAAALAAEDDLAARRVAFLAKGLKNVELTLAVQRAYREYKAAGNIERYGAAMQELDEFRASVEDELIANMGFLSWGEARTWDRELLKLMTQPGERLPGPWKLAWDPDKRGEGEGWFAPDLDDAEWLPIGINGPWEEQEAGKAWRDEHQIDYNGLAWYRTSFTVPDTGERVLVRLIFGAVDEACKVWVNGKLALERPYPYQGNQDSWQEAFEVDVSDLAQPGKANVLAVQVEDNTGAGGIWKPVWIMTSPAAAEAEDNAVADPGFEEADTVWRPHVQCGKYEFGRDTSVAFSGEASGRIQCTELAPPEVEEKYGGRAWARWYQTGIVVEKGATYRLRARVRTSREFNGSVKIWVTGTMKQTMQAQMLNTGGVWREAVIEDIIPADDSVVIYLNLMDGTGTAWLDDIELTKSGQ